MKRACVYIRTAEVPNQLTPAQEREALARLSSDDQQRLARYVFRADRLRSLTGRLLLTELSQAMGYKGNILSKVVILRNGRPCVSAGPDFNISHAADRVVCAASWETRVGVDIESIREIRLEDFKDQMTQDQWASIQDSSNPTYQFFRIWTMKESAVKADGGGLSIPFHAMETDCKRVTTPGKCWHLTELDFGYGYVGWLAAADAEVELKITSRAVSNVTNLARAQSDFL